MIRTLFTTTALAAALCGTAFAQNVPQDGETENQQDGAPATADSTDNAPPNDGDLPKPQSDNDPQPEVAGPDLPSGGLVEQAGVGGAIGYGRAGVLELGGTAGFVIASGLTQVSVAPSVGWFLADNLELSAILNLAYASTEDAMGNSIDSTSFGLLAEPSYHVPFNRTTFGFAGLGIGPAWVKGPGLGLAIAPRVGGNFLVGRSGVLTPSVSWQYTTHDFADSTPGTVSGPTYLQVSSAVSANVGYTVMW